MGKTGRKDIPRSRGTGRGTDNAWSQLPSLEGGPVPINISEGEKTDHRIINPVGMESNVPEASHAVSVHASPEVGQRASEVQPSNSEPAKTDQSNPESVTIVSAQYESLNVEAGIPKFFIEKNFSHYLKEFNSKINLGLSLIREINSNVKICKLAEDLEDERKKKKLEALLKKVSFVDPDNQALKDEMNKLKNFDTYNMDALRSMLYSHPKIVALKKSDLSAEEKGTEKQKLIKTILRHAVKETYENHEAAGVGETAKIALDLKEACEKGLLEIAENAPAENPSNSESVESSETEKGLDQIKEAFVEQILKDKNGIIAEIYAAFGEKLINSRVHEIINKIGSNDGKKEILDNIRQLAPEETDSLPELDILVKRKLKEMAIRDHWNQIFEGRGTPAPKGEKEVKIEEIFSPEQIEKLDQIVQALKTNYLQELEEAKKWPGGWKGEKGQERARSVVQDMKWASTRQAYDTLVRNFKFALMHRDVGVDYMTKKIFGEE